MLMRNNFPDLLQMVLTILFLAACLLLNITLEIPSDCPTFLYREVSKITTPSSPPFLAVVTARYPHLSLLDAAAVEQGCS